MPLHKPKKLIHLWILSRQAMCAKQIKLVFSITQLSNSLSSVAHMHNNHMNDFYFIYDIKTQFYQNLWK